MSKKAYSAARLGGLRRFAVAITAFNVLGHTLFGFEQSVLQPLVALAVAYGMELILETVDAVVHARTPRYAGGPRNLVNSLLSAHITGLAVTMLLYSNDRLAPIAFATAVAIGSKTLFRVRVGTKVRHFMNPSNIGISATLLLFPWVGIAPPYHFTENLYGWGDWLLPALIVASGTALNARYARRLPLIGAWLIGFIVQAGVRSALHDTSLAAALLPMTGVAFLLFTFYMITDPATSPSRPRDQIAFGLATAAAYGALMSIHAVFGLFFGLSAVCFLRGARFALQTALGPATSPAPAEVGGARAGAALPIREAGTVSAR